MSTAELERFLARRTAEDRDGPGGAVPLSIEDALAYRDAGNLPDAHGRTLRLALRVDPAGPPLEVRRLSYEPDFHDAPAWRRTGSVPINIVPLRSAGEHRSQPRPWFEAPALAALEREWRATGAVAGVRVPEELRGFVYKTVLALRAAGHEVTVDALASSIARWVPPAEAAELRAALERANRG